MNRTCVMPHASVCDVLGLSDDGAANQSSVGQRARSITMETPLAACATSLTVIPSSVSRVASLQRWMKMVISWREPVIPCENSEVLCEAVGLPSSATVFGACRNYEHRECGNGLIEPYGGEAVTMEILSPSSVTIIRAVCNNECFEVEGQGPACGDGTVDIGFEACDDGNTETESCDCGALSCGL